MSEKYGIKETVDLIVCMRELAISAKRAKKAGGGPVTLIKEFWDDFAEVTEALEGIELVDDEARELSQPEIHKLLDEVFAAVKAVKEA